MKKDKLKKIVDIANKQVKSKPKKEIEEGILDDTFSIPEFDDKPTGNSEINVKHDTDRSARINQNIALRSALSSPTSLFFMGLYEDSILSKDDDMNGDLVDDTHFESDDLVSSIENVVKLIPQEPKKLKAIFNLFSELIKNIEIEELPEEVRHKLCKKIMNKNSKLINNY
jgi:hypothetical protein